jgi:hypothetical protein
MRAITFVALAGCSQILGVGDFHSGTSDATGTTPGDGSSNRPIDAAIPVGPDAPPVNCAQISTQLDPCSAIGSAMPLHLTSNATWTTGGQLTRDSDSSQIPILTYSPGGGLDINAILVTTFELDAGVTLHTDQAIGSPLAIIASDTITVNGLIDVSAGGAGVGQFEENSEACTMMWQGSGAQIPAGSAAFAGGGGGGASMQGSGAAGGDGVLGSIVSRAGGVTPGKPLPKEGPYGGCDGGGGAFNFEGTGYGGGAVYLASATGIVIGTTGGLNAGGGGGFGGISLEGGEGGGAGGTIMLEAPGVEMNGTLAANGGGGGQGGGSDNGENGQSGQLGTTAAKGGSSGKGGHGGTGGAGTTVSGSGAQGTSVGGGGGGGGVGYIIIHSTVTTGSGVYSPAPMN